MRAVKITLKIILAIAVFTLILMLLWNWLVPSLFGGPVITYVQSLGLLILAKILFGGFGKSFGDHRRSRSHYYWKKFGEKLENMTPEEREKFKADMC